MSENTFDGEVREKNEKFQRVPDMLELNRFFEGETCTKVNYREVAASLPKSVREKITSRFEMKNLAKIFEDQSMMQTVETYLDCGMNISETARRLYMHRNTLIYRLDQVEKRTGLDLRRFEDAMTSKIASLVMNYLQTERNSEHE